MVPDAGLGMVKCYPVGGRPDGANPGFPAWSRDDLLPCLAERHECHKRLAPDQIEAAKKEAGGRRRLPRRNDSAAVIPTERSRVDRICHNRDRA